MADADLLVIMAPDLAARVADWRRSLADVRRVSPRTVEAYDRDVEGFVRFLPVLPQEEN